MQKEISELRLLYENLKEQNKKKQSAYGNQSKDIEYPCEKCNFTFESRSGYEKHLQGIQHNTGVRNDSFVEEDEEEEEQFKEKCYFCKKTFLSYDNLDDHQSNYIRCEKCVICYHNEFEYEKHEHCDD